MAEAKTKPTKQSVTDFIKSLPDAQTRADCSAVAKLMEAATKSKGIMLGSNIAGFGITTIKYAGGKEADWPLIAFSPRKQSLTFYISASDPGKTDLLARLGKHKVSGSCLHIKRLSDVNLAVMKKLIEVSVKPKYTRLKA